MGSVAVTFRILPEDAEADLEPVKARVRKTLGGALRDLKEQPVALGLRAILAIAVVGDAEGGSARLEQSLAALPGVRRVETVDATLVRSPGRPVTESRPFPQDEDRALRQFTEPIPRRTH